MIAGRRDTIGAWRPVLDSLRDQYGIVTRIADGSIHADALFAVTGHGAQTAWVGCRGWRDDAGRTGRTAQEWARVRVSDLSDLIRRHLSPSGHERDRILDALHAAGITQARRVLDWKPTSDGLLVEWAGEGATCRHDVIDPDVDGSVRAWCDRLDAYANA